MIVKCVKFTDTCMKWHVDVQLNPGYSHIKEEDCSCLNPLFDFGSVFDCTGYPQLRGLVSKKRVLKNRLSPMLMCVFMSHSEQNFYCHHLTLGLIVKKCYKSQTVPGVNAQCKKNNCSICLPPWQMLSAVKTWLYFLFICSLAKPVLFQLLFWIVSFLKNP